MSDPQQPSRPPVPPPAHVGERGGPWDSVSLDPAFHPALQTVLPMVIVYIRDGTLGWLPHLLIAESALLRRAGAPRGLGVYALKRFRGPREPGGNNGDEIGHYGGKVIASAPTQKDANKLAQSFVQQGHQYLMALRVQGHVGWHVVDGEERSVMPSLYRVNDPRGTPFATRCTVSEFGLFRAARDIPPLDWTRPLSEQAASELSFEYGAEYWDSHDLLGSADLPLTVGSHRAATGMEAGWMNKLFEKRFRELAPGGYAIVSLHANAFIRLEYRYSMLQPVTTRLATDDDGDASARVASFRIYPSSTERQFREAIGEMEGAAVGALEASWAPLYASWIWWRLSMLPTDTGDGGDQSEGALKQVLSLIRTYVEGHRDEHAHRIPSFRGDEGARPLFSSDDSDGTAAALSGLAVGCPVQSKRQLRGSRADAPPTPNLTPEETDAEGRTVYVDLQPSSDDPSLQALRSRLSHGLPTARMLERLPLINRSRVLVEIEDRAALDLFQSWLVATATSGSAAGALGRLLQPLGTQILLVGAHLICPRVTEYEPRILQQSPHTDVGTKGEVIGIGLHIHGDAMRTLIDPRATLSSDGSVQGGAGLRQADTSAFAFDTGAVHAGPGTPHVPGPYPRFLTNRVFFLLASASLPPVQIAKHRADNGLVGAANLTFSLPPLP